MSEINSKLAAQAELNNSMRPDSIEAEGRVRFLNDSVIFDGVVSSGDTVALLSPLPKGCLIDPARSMVVVDTALSGGTAADVGVEGVADNIASAVDLGTVGSVAGQGALITAQAGNVKLTLTNGTPDNGDTIRVSIAYYVR